MHCKRPMWKFSLFVCFFFCLATENRLGAFLNVSVHGEGIAFKIKSEWGFKLTDLSAN